MRARYSVDDQCTMIPTFTGEADPSVPTGTKLSMWENTSLGRASKLIEGLLTDDPWPSSLGSDAFGSSAVAEAAVTVARRRLPRPDISGRRGVRQARLSKKLLHPLSRASRKASGKGEVQGASTVYSIMDWRERLMSTQKHSARHDRPPLTRQGLTGGATEVKNNKAG